MGFRVEASRFEVSWYAPSLSGPGQLTPPL